MTRFGFARTSTLRPPRSSATRRSASRQSSLPITRNCQQIATNHCTELGDTRSTRAFIAFHNLLKRFMKAQLLEQCMVRYCTELARWLRVSRVYIKIGVLVGLATAAVQAPALTVVPRSPFFSTCTPKYCGYKNYIKCG